MNQLPASLDFKDILPSSAMINAYFEAVDHLYQSEHTYEDEQFCQTYFEEQYPTVSRHIDFALLCYVDTYFLEQLEEQFRIMEARGNRMHLHADTHDKQTIAIILADKLQNLDGKCIPEVFRKSLFLLLGIREYHDIEHSEIYQETKQKTHDILTKLFQK